MDNDAIVYICSLIHRMAAEDTQWTKIIRPKRSLFDLDLRSAFRSKDLLSLFVKRDIIAVYKQTVLGPLWFLIQPVLTTIMFVTVFSGIAGISTDAIPPVLFYLGGITCWNYFAECLNKTSNIFVENQHVFGKVYFPRIISPLAVVMTSLIKFGIQFLLFIAVYLFYLFAQDTPLNISGWFILLPALIVLMGILGLGFGMIISSLTTKYRDLRFLIQFGVQLWMYATPIIYPVSLLEGKAKTLVYLNPMTSIVETFKYIFFGTGELNGFYLGYTVLLTVVVLLLGMVIFNKTEQNFMDTV